MVMHKFIKVNTFLQQKQSEAKAFIFLYFVPHCPFLSSHRATFGAVLRLKVGRLPWAVVWDCEHWCFSVKLSQVRVLVSLGHTSGTGLHNTYVTEMKASVREIKESYCQKEIGGN